MKKLYKRTATGAIQVWWQELNLYATGYRTCSGQMDGKVTYSEYTMATPKNRGRSNETTAEQQARLEVEANYTLKQKAGYTDHPAKARVSTRFQPMLAKIFEDYSDDVISALVRGQAVYSQPKLDGIRCIATAQGLKSRQGNPILAVPHIVEALAPVFADCPDMVLDGELYAHEYAEDFNRIVSLVKKTKPTAEDLEQSAEHIQYWIYDTPGPSGFGSRFRAMADVVVGAQHESLVVVPTTRVTSHDHLDKLYDAYTQNDFEGQMLRFDGPYEQKRSKLLLKRKGTKDSEFCIVGIYEGQGNRSGMAGYAVLQLGKERTFRANIKGTREHLKAMLQASKDLIGKQATVEYFDLTPDGVPRFPRIKAIHTTQRW